MLHTEEGVEGVDEAIYIDKRMTLRIMKFTSEICGSLMRYAQASVSLMR